MADNGPGEHGGDTGSSRRRWNWSAGLALGIGVGLAFGTPFIPSLGGFGVAIGLAIGAGLVPVFALAMARPADTDQDPRERR